MNGTSSNEMIDKFHILNHISLKIIIEDHLRFRIDRYLLKNYNNALELNLKVPNWEQEYKKILEGTTTESNHTESNRSHRLRRQNVMPSHQLRRQNAVPGSWLTVLFAFSSNLC